MTLPGADAAGGPARRELRREVLAVLVVLAVALLAFGWQWQRPQARTGTADSYWYLTDAARYAGTPPGRAAAEAGRLYCAELQRSYRLGGRPRGCVSYVAEGVSPRYRAIFASRPGLPVAAAPAVAGFGLRAGMALVTGGFFVAVALAGYGALRAGRTGRAGAVVGGTALTVLPLGYWDSRMLAEGAAATGVLVATGAAVLLLRRRSPGRLYLLAAALAWAFVTKPAAGAAVSLALVLAGVTGAAARWSAARRAGTDRSTRLRRLRRGGWTAVTAVSAAVLAAWSVLARALGLPGLSETVQDLATRHFRSPDVPDPTAYLARRAASLWWHLAVGVPWGLIVVAAACVLAVRWGRGTGVVWTAAALSGVLVVTAHPLHSEYPRLVATTWIAVAAALGMGADRGLALVAARRAGGPAGPPGRLIPGPPPGRTLPRTRPVPPAG